MVLAHKLFIGYAVHVCVCVRISVEQLHETSERVAAEKRVIRMGANQLAEIGNSREPGLTFREIEDNVRERSKFKRVDPIPSYVKERM